MEFTEYYDKNITGFLDFYADCDFWCTFDDKVSKTILNKKWDHGGNEH